MNVSIKNNTLELLELAQWTVGRNAIEVMSHFETLRKKGYPETTCERQIIKEKNIAVLATKIEFADGTLYCAILNKQCMYSMLTLNSKETIIKLYALCKQNYTSFMDKYWLNRNIQISFVHRNALLAINFNEIFYTEFDDKELNFTNHFSN